MAEQYGPLGREITPQDLTDEPVLHEGGEVDHEQCAVFPAVGALDIKKFRVSRGMTQEQFARAYDISLRTVKRWEGDSVTPRFGESLRRILADWLSSNSQVKT